MASFRDLISPANIARQFLPQGFLPGTPGDGGGGGFMPNINLRFGGGPEEAQEEQIKEQAASNIINNLLFLEQFKSEETDVEPLLGRDFQQLLGATGSDYSDAANQIASLGRTTDQGQAFPGSRTVTAQDTAFDAAERTNQAVREDAGRTVDQGGAFDAREPDPKAKTEAAKRFFEGRPYPGDAASQELAERLELPSTKPRAEDYFPGIERQKPFDTTTAPEEIVGARPVPEPPGKLSILADLLKDPNVQRLIGTGIIGAVGGPGRGREAAAFTGLMDEASKRRLEQQKVAFEKEQAKTTTRLKEKSLEIQEKDLAVRLATLSGKQKDAQLNLVSDLFFKNQDKYTTPGQVVDQAKALENFPDRDGNFPYKNLADSPFIQDIENSVANKRARDTYYGEYATAHLKTREEFEALSSEAKKGFTGPIEGYKLAALWTGVQGRVLTRGKTKTPEERQREVDTDPKFKDELMQLDRIAGVNRYVRTGQIGPPIQLTEMITTQQARGAAGIVEAEYHKSDPPDTKRRLDAIETEKDKQKDVWKVVTNKKMIVPEAAGHMKNPATLIAYRDQLIADAAGKPDDSQEKGKLDYFNTMVGPDLSSWETSQGIIRKLQDEDDADRIAVAAVKRLIEYEGRSFDPRTATFTKPIDPQDFLDNQHPELTPETSLQMTINSTILKQNQVEERIKTEKAFRRDTVDLENQLKVLKAAVKAYRNPSFRNLFMQNYGRIVRPRGGR